MKSLIRIFKKRRLICAGLIVFQFGGCVSSAQLSDFFFQEIARITADLTGQIFLILVQAISPLSAA